MTHAITLVPLVCGQCRAELPAEPGEVAWVCPQCGQGWWLDEPRDRLQAMTVNYAAGLKPNQIYRPFWVAQGQVLITRRETYGGNKTGESQAFWRNPRFFFIPAFACSLEDVTQMGAQMLRETFNITAGPPVPFAPVTVLPDDMRALAEFIVLNVEAARSDALKEIQFEVRLGQPQLWALA